MNRIKKVKPVNENYYQGYYRPLNEEKYVGDCSEIIYRSSYERKFMVFCDSNTNIIKWASEPIGIKYLNPLDKKTHTYYIDFWIKVLNSRGIEEKVLIEIKPKKQLERPIFEGRYKVLSKIKSYNKSMEMYIINLAKFSAAKDFAEKNKMRFMILTEDFLFGKKRQDKE